MVNQRRIFVCRGLSKYAINSPGLFSFNSPAGSAKKQRKAEVMEGILEMMETGDVEQS